MDQSIRDAIFSLQRGDSVSFKSGIRNALDQRAIDAVELERVAIGQKVFSGQTDEYEEDNNEEI